MKLLILFILSLGLFSQTGIPYYNNGVLTYVKPIGGIIVDVNRKQIRTAINGGLRGTPNQIWLVNSKGDGEAINVDWNVFAILPPGTDGKRTLTVIKRPQTLYFTEGIHTFESYDYDRVMNVFYSGPAIINFLQANNHHSSTKEFQVERIALGKNVLWVYQNGLFRIRNKDYTLTYDTDNAIIKFSDIINIKEGDGITVISIN